MIIRLRKAEIPPHLLRFFRPDVVRYKPKDLVNTPALLAESLRADGWYLRAEIIFAKRNPMPESVKDRPTRAHEQVFLLSKSPRYFYDGEAVKQAVTGTSHPRSKPCNPKRQASDRNESRAHARFSAPDLVDRAALRSVWWLSSESFKGAHFATFPKKLVAPCIRAGTSERGVCPACGASWVRQVGRRRAPTRPGADTKVTEAPDYYRQLNAENPGVTHGLGSHPTAKRHPNSMSLGVGNRDPRRHCTTTETTGWAPSCSCDAGEPVPATVLDPFCGAGTTLLVARRLGRRAVGIDLSPKYVAMARRRVEQDSPLFNRLGEVPGAD